MTTSALERFLRYVIVDTRSDEHSTTVPSTPGQLVLLRQLVSELRAMGIGDAAVDEHGYVMATIPATQFPFAPRMGLEAGHGEGGRGDRPAEPGVDGGNLELRT
jgi:tripeptide aminopeptidase